MTGRNGHWEGCWAAPGRHDCAIRLVEGFKRRFAAADLREVENLAGYGPCVRAPSYWRPGDVVRLLRVEESMASRPAESDHTRRDEEMPEGRHGDNSSRSWTI